MPVAQTIHIPAPEFFNPQSGRLDATPIAHEQKMEQREPPVAKNFYRSETGCRSILYRGSVFTGG